MRSAIGHGTLDDVVTPHFFLPTWQTCKNISFYFVFSFSAFPHSHAVPHTQCIFLIWWYVCTNSLISQFTWPQAKTMTMREQAWAWESSTIKKINNWVYANVLRLLCKTETFTVKRVWVVNYYGLKKVGWISNLLHLYYPHFSLTVIFIFNFNLAKSLARMKRDVSCIGKLLLTLDFLVGEKKAPKILATKINWLRQT